MGAVELRDITMEDLPLYERLLSDPGTMAELGGPLPRNGLRRKLRGIVDDVRAGRLWYFTIHPDHDADAAGTVCIWDHDTTAATSTRSGGWCFPTSRVEGWPRRRCARRSEGPAWSGGGT